MEQIVKLNPAEYGLQEVQAQTIEQAFMPKIVERDALKPMYEELIIGELTPELCSDAKALRLKLVKVRTGIAEIHKTQKAFYLAAGRYVDAWKNKETLPVEQMEEKLEAIEKYFENIEKERKQKLRDERLIELQKYETDGTLLMLGEMSDEVWNNYLAGVKLQFDARKEAERKAEEARLAEIEAEKKRQEEIRLENERLKKEREELEKQAEIERKKQVAEMAKAEKARKEAEAKMLLQAKADRERIEAERQAREKAEAALLAQKEAEEKARKEAEARALAEETARIKAEKKLAAAPDKEKLLRLAETINTLELPVLKTPEAAEIIGNVKTLLNKVNAYIIEKANNL
jgi:hypothetical protein